MKELKFRAWDKKDKKMYKIISFLSFNKDGRLNAIEDCNIKDVEIMQFTGAKDKDGTEIYEGDICYKRGYGKNCIIRWSEERLKWEAFYGIGTSGGDLAIGLGYWNTGETENVFGDTLKIKGNIYENSNLLNKKLLGNKEN